MDTMRDKRKTVDRLFLDDTESIIYLCSTSSLTQYAQVIFSNSQSANRLTIQCPVKIQSTGQAKKHSDDIHNQLCVTQKKPMSNKYEERAFY